MQDIVERMNKLVRKKRRDEIPVISYNDINIILETPRSLFAATVWLYFRASEETSSSSAAAEYMRARRKRKFHFSVH